MKPKYLFLIIFFVSILIDLAFPSSGTAAVKGVWMYRFSDLDNSGTISDLIAMEINQVFLSIDAEKLPGGDDYSEEYTAKVRDFIAKAHLQGIRVHAMTLEDARFTYLSHHWQGKKLVRLIINYCRMYPDAPFDGIHIDVEPHTLKEWDLGDWKTRESLMKRYSRLLRKLQMVIKRSSVSLEFSAAIAWWYNEKAEEGLLPSGDATKLKRYLDFLAPMVFGGIGGSPEDIIWRVEDEVREAPTLIGIGADEFDDYASITKAIAELNAYFSGQSNYMGVCVFNYAKLKEKFESP